jgi:hypothetical protein
MTARHMTAPLLLAALAVSTLAGCSSDDSGPAPCDRSIVGNICTLAGSGDNGYEGDDGPALSALLSLPQDTLTDADGTIYVLDWNNHRIRKLTTDGKIEHVAGRGELGGTLDDPANGDFNHPTSMLFENNEQYIVIAAWHNSKIRRLDLLTGEIIDTCGDGRRAYFGDEGPALTSTLDLPASIAWDPAGNLVVMDQANQVLRSIDAEGTIHHLYGRCVIEPAGVPAVRDGCEPTPCPAPSGKSTCGDPMTTCAGACTPGFNGDDVPAVDMRIAQPFGQSAYPAGRIVYDTAGNLYFADTGNAIIRRIDGDGIARRIAGLAPEGGRPQEGYSGDGGPATEAELNAPVDLALDSDGTLYFSDVYNNCVRKIDPDGIIDTVAGICGGRSGILGDGVPAREAALRLPYGIELVGDELLISDSGHNQIRSVRLR